MAFIKLINKRRAWFCVIILVYTILLTLSYNFLKTSLSWHASNVNSYALQASLLLGVGLGILSMVAASAVAVPAILVAWITVLVLLNVAGKSNRTLIKEGKKLSIDIIGLMVKCLIKEGNIVAMVSAVFGFVAFVSKGRG